MPSSSSAYITSAVITTGGTTQKVLSEGTGPGTAPDAPTAMQSAIIKARKGNTSPLYIGTANTVSATTGLELQPGDGVSLDILGLGNLWIVGATTNDRYDIFGT